MHPSGVRLRGSNNEKMACVIEQDSCTTVAGAALEDGFCASWLSEDVPGARGLHVTDSGDVLAVARGRSPAAVVSLVDSNNDGKAEKVSVIAVQSTLTHGLAVHGNYVYASSDTTVFRWPYQSGQKTQSSDASKEIVIKNMNANGSGGAPRGHTTRSLVFDKKGRLFVSVGSAGNVDKDSHRSRIRRFDLTTIPSGGLDFRADGTVFADGLRNEVGLAFDSHEMLWGVENSADNLARQDLGGDIHNENPAEELNRFTTSGQNFGYPFCWTEYKLPKSVSPTGRGTIWAWPSTMNDGTHDDAWCRANTVAPAMAMQAHSAPLGITFFNASKSTPATCSGQSFPSWMDGDAFIAFHGSWNRDIPTGYKVVRVPMDKGGNPSVTEPLDFFCHGGSSAKWPSGMRPVDVKFDACNRLLISSDGTHSRGSGIVLISYAGKRKRPEINGTGCAACGAGPGPIPWEWIIPLAVVVCVLSGVALYAWKTKKWCFHRRAEVRQSCNESPDKAPDADEITDSANTA